MADADQTKDIPSTFEAKCRCGRVFKAKAEFAGKRARCPSCKTVLRLPDADTIRARLREQSESSADHASALRKPVVFWLTIGQCALLLGSFLFPWAYAGEDPEVSNAPKVKVGEVRFSDGTVMPIYRTTKTLYFGLMFGPGLVAAGLALSALLIACATFHFMGEKVMLASVIVISVLLVVLLCLVCIHLEEEVDHLPKYANENGRNTHPPALPQTKTGVVPVYLSIDGGKMSSPEPSWGPYVSVVLAGILTTTCVGALALRYGVKTAGASIAFTVCVLGALWLLWWYVTH